MKSSLIRIVLLVSLVLWAMGCGDSKEDKKDLGAAVSSVKREEGIGLIKAQTRLHPGWACPNHPHVQSYFPGDCPIDKVPLLRKGEWTCPNHAHVSATSVGNCPICNEQVAKVEEVVKKAGKPIEELTKEALAKAEKK